MLLRFRGRDSTDEQTSRRADEPRGPGKKCDNNKIKSNQEEIPPPTDPNGPLAGRRMSCAESSSHSVVIQDQAGVTDTSSCNPPQVANSRKSRQEPTRRSPAAWCKPPTGGAGGRVLAAVPAAVPQLWLPPNTDCLLHGKPNSFTDTKYRLPLTWKTQGVSCRLQTPTPGHVIFSRISPTTQRLQTPPPACLRLPPTRVRPATGRLSFISVWSCRRGAPHVWLGSIRPRSQCVGGMLLVQWCYKHVLNCLSYHSFVKGSER